MEALFGMGLMLPFIRLYLGLMALAISAYFFLALALQTLARRRGIPGGAMAWVPVARMWLLGKISDDYQARVYRQRGGMGPALLVLSILQAILYGLFLGGAVWLMVNSSRGRLPKGFLWAPFGILGGSGSGWLTPGWMLLLWGLNGLASVVVLAARVLTVIALNRIYRSCDPQKATLFTVLAAVSAQYAAVVLFAVCGKDAGIPACWQIPYQFETRT